MQEFADEAPGGDPGRLPDARGLLLEDRRGARGRRPRDSGGRLAPRRSRSCAALAGDRLHGAREASTNIRTWTQQNCTERRRRRGARSRSWRAAPDAGTARCSAGRLEARACSLGRMAAPVHRGDEVELEVDSLAYGGNGVARLGGFVVFVRRGLPGDTVRARVTKVQRRHAEADAIELVEGGPARVEAPCQHFPACGGCRFQDLAYEAQVEAKAAWVERLAAADRRDRRPADRADRAGGGGLRLPQQDGVLVRARARTGPSSGLHRAGRWDEVLGIEQCWLTTDLGNAIRNAMRDWAREERLEAYDQAEGNGLPAASDRARGPEHGRGARSARDARARAVRPRAADRGADRVPAGALDPLGGQRHAGRGDEPADAAPLGRRRDRGGARRPALPRAPERVPADEHAHGRAAVRARARARPR